MVGTPSIFLRLAGCNLRCYWCDTAYTWLYSQSMADRIRTKIGSLSTTVELNVYNRDEETTKLTVDEILEEFHAYPGSHIVITGGEPLLQKEGLIPFTRHLLGNGFSIEIETNGTKSPDGLPEGIRFNVSPKLENSYNDKERRYRPDILREFSHCNSIFKFVISSERDLKEVEEIIGQNRLPQGRIYLMPEGKTSEELREKSSWLVDICKARNYNYTHRLHIDIFEKTRGV